MELCKVCFIHLYQAQDPERLEPSSGVARQTITQSSWLTEFQFVGVSWVSAYSFVQGADACHCSVSICGMELPRYPWRRPSRPRTKKASNVITSKPDHTHKTQFASITRLTQRESQHLTIEKSSESDDQVTSRIGPQELEFLPLKGLPGRASLPTPPNTPGCLSTCPSKRAHARIHITNKPPYNRRCQHPKPSMIKLDLLRSLFEDPFAGRHKPE